MTKYSIFAVIILMRYALWEIYLIYYQKILVSTMR